MGLVIFYSSTSDQLLGEQTIVNLTRTVHGTCYSNYKIHRVH